MIKESGTLIVSEKEIEELAYLYKQLHEPNRNLVVTGCNLLLASQQARKNEMEKNRYREQVKE